MTWWLRYAELVSHQGFLREEWGYGGCEASAFTQVGVLSRAAPAAPRARPHAPVNIFHTTNVVSLVDKNADICGLALHARDVMACGAHGRDAVKRVEQFDVLGRAGGGQAVTRHPTRSHFLARDGGGAPTSSTAHPLTSTAGLLPVSAIAYGYAAGACPLTLSG